MAAALALYFAAHLPFLAPSLEDLDSINFALGLRDFDVANHQPHPPGYPVYIALARLSLTAVEAVAPSLDRIRAETLALALWSAASAAVAIGAAWFVFRACSTSIGGRSFAPGWGAVLLAAAPLFWVTGLRPMSDMPGLAAALVAQAALLESLRQRRYVVWGALAAGMAAGIRIQTVWLTFPLVAVAIFARRAEGLAWLVTRPIAALAAGVLVWAVPLVVASGGVDRYLAAVGAQAGEDLTFIDLVWTNPTVRRLAFSLYETFVLPWGSVPLALVVGGVAVLGALVTFQRERRGLALMAVAFLPFAVFHLLFHETIHVRYALPVIVPLAWLAANGLLVAGRAAPVAAAAIGAGAALVAGTTALAYASEVHPAFRAIGDMTRAAAVERPAAVYSHHGVRRALQAQRPDGVRVVEPPRFSEWKDLVAYWRSGGTQPVWFLANPSRTDLAVIDPESRRDVTRYRWNAERHAELSGVRPPAVDWYRFHRPGWFAGDGWSLTPELGGITAATRTGLDHRPIEALVRRRPERTFAVVGARHFGTASDAGASFSLRIDGVSVAEWELQPSRGPNVLTVLELPAGTLVGDGPYARLTITAQSLRAGTPTPPVAIRQFNIQSDTGLIHAFGEGWHEAEYENATGLSWRWTSDRSVLRIVPPQGVRLRMRGESPLRYVDAPPTVRITAGSRVVAEFHPDDDFEWTVTISSADVLDASGRIAIETTPVYVPGAAEGTLDKRRLGLRVFELDVSQVLP